MGAESLVHLEAFSSTTAAIHAPFLQAIPRRELRPFAKCSPPHHDLAVSQAYESLAAELHDAFQNADGPSPELPLIVAFLGHYPGRALEIGCGSGRLLLPLRQQGFDIEGLELSSPMLEMARQKARQDGLELKLNEGDMCNWKPDQRYSSLLAPSFTLQLAEDPAATLKHWSSWMEPGGGLYLTVFMPYGELIGELPEGEWYEDHEVALPGGERATLETRHQIDMEHSCIRREHRYRVEGRPDAQHDCTETIHWAEPSQWQKWLEAAGFVVDRCDLDWDPNLQLEDPGPEDFDGILTFEARLKT